MPRRDSSEARGWSDPFWFFDNVAACGYVWKALDDGDGGIFIDMHRVLVRHERTRSPTILMDGAVEFLERYVERYGGYDRLHVVSHADSDDAGWYHFRTLNDLLPEALRIPESQFHPVLKKHLKHQVYREVAAVFRTRGWTEPLVALDDTEWCFTGVGDRTRCYLFAGDPRRWGGGV